jgi:hypothetical protein
MKFVGTNISSGIINFVSYCPTNCFSFLIIRRVKVDGNFNGELCSFNVL